MDWAERYRPERLQDIVGNMAVVRQMAEWARDWTFKSRPIILYGKPGVGKTSAAHALAHDMGWETIELNASDQRTATVIERVAGAGSITASLSGASRRLIIIDEADNLQGVADRGGARAILDCIRTTRQPVILIANDLYGIAPEIRARCEPLQFKAIPARSVVPRLKYICASEKVSCSEGAVREIAESAGGDLRSAINILYASSVGRSSLDDTQINTGQKDDRISIFTLITAIAAERSDDELLRLSREVEDTPETIEQWVEGNLSLIVPPASLSAAYRNLARADEYLGNTYRRQYHILWRYATALILIGVAGTGAGKGIHARIMPPARWQKMAGAKRQKMIRTTTLARMAGMMHIPATTLRGEYLTTINQLVEIDPETFVSGLGLDADQLNFFLADRARSLAVLAEVTRAVKEQQKEKEKQEKGVRGKGKKNGWTPGDTVQKGDIVPGAGGSPVQKETGVDTPPEPGSERKNPQGSQSTLFDGF